MTLQKRLLPLYLCSFFQGIVFWYVVEKLFMKSIGYSDATIGLVTSLLAGVVLLVSFPAGVLADRWSRRGVLILAGLSLAGASLIGALSHNPLFYAMSSCLWGVYAALSVGTYDSIIYDVLVEEEGASHNFEKYYGRLQLFNSAALVLASLMGSIIASHTGLRFPYFLTIPFILISILFLLRFKEPTLHHVTEKTALITHMRETIGAVLTRRSVLWIVVVMILAAVGTRLMFEFSQLWYIALAFPIIFFGPANALVSMCFGFSGLIAQQLKVNRARLLTFCGFMILCSTILTTHLSILVVLSITLLLSGYMALTILLNHQLHDTLPSRIRAGSSSAVSSIGQIFFIPTSIFFGIVSNKHTPFVAAYIPVVLTVLIFITVILVPPIKHHKSAKSI